MNGRFQAETSFSAKMVLLFALVFLAMPSRRKGLELYVKGIFKTDTSTMGQIPATRIATSNHFQSSFNR
jgi:isopentenyl diphosphate isomerase/L-lactate dehydrogenase-like FMN-dependent dehydrogenase